jgi:hypothetical protein
MLEQSLYVITKEGIIRDMTLSDRRLFSLIEK